MGVPTALQRPKTPCGGECSAGSPVCHRTRQGEATPGTQTVCGQPSPTGQASLVLRRALSSKREPLRLLPTAQPPAGEEPGVTPQQGRLASLSGHFLLPPSLPLRSAEGLRAALGPRRAPGGHAPAAAGRRAAGGSRSQPCPRPQLHKPELWLRASLDCFLCRRAGPGRAAPCARRPAESPPKLSLSFPLLSAHGKPHARQCPPCCLPSRRSRCPRGGRAEAAAQPRLLPCPGAAGPGCCRHRLLLRLLLLRRRPPGSAAREAEGGEGEAAGQWTAPPPPPARPAAAASPGPRTPGGRRGRAAGRSLARSLALRPGSELCPCPPPCPGHGARPGGSV